MPKTLYEVFTGEKPLAPKWVSQMTVDQMYKRLDVLRFCLNKGKSRRGLKSLLKRQKQEILDEFEKRGIRIYSE
tara:strand:+ start:354 stop:575 length:222 start_codon:yes stop_codon:yes gene_type:complete